MKNNVHFLVNHDFVNSNSKYFKLYCQIINKGEIKHIPFNTQTHHIIPRSTYNRLNLPINNSKDNLVLLTIKNHILAHYYLYLCAKDKLFKSQNGWAVLNIVNGNKNKIDLDKWIYEKNFNKDLEKIVKVIKKGLIRSEEHKQKTSKTLMGHEVSKETREKLSLHLKGNIPGNTNKVCLYHPETNIVKYFSKNQINKKLKEGWIKGFPEKLEKEKAHYKHPEGITTLYNPDTDTVKHVLNSNLAYIQDLIEQGFIKNKSRPISKSVRRKIGKSNKNKVFIYKGNKRKFVLKEEAKKYTQEGWKIGIGKRKKPKEFKKWIHKGNECLKVYEKDLPKYVSEGWQRGTGKKPWNYIKTKSWHLKRLKIINKAIKESKIDLTKRGGVKRLSKIIALNEYIIRTVLNYFNIPHFGFTKRKIQK